MPGNRAGFLSRSTNTTDRDLIDVNKPLAQTTSRRPAAKSWLWILLLLLVAGAIYYFYSYINVPNIEVFAARDGKVVSAVYGTVKVEYDYTRALRAENGGYVEFSEGISSGRISEGRPVKKGEVLAKIVDEEIENRIRRARINLDAAEDRRKLGPPSEQLLNTATDTLRRLERLSASTKTVAAADLEKARNEVTRLGEAVETEKIEINREIETFREELDLLLREADKNVLISPIDGIIKSVSVSDGDLVSGNSTIFELAKEGLHILGEVNEEDVGLLEPGMKTSVKLYSFPNSEFDAELQRVLPTGDNQRYSVIVRLTEPPDNLKAGMTGEMNIIIGERADTIYIPTRAVQIDQVLVVEDEIIRQRTVETGFRNLEFVEIINGLSAGTLVVVEDQDMLKPGERVRYSVMNDKETAP